MMYRGWLLLLLCAVVNARDVVRLLISSKTVEITPSGFDEFFFVQVEKVGLGPGRAFQLLIGWDESTLCIPTDWYKFSQTYYNGTDVVYVPRSALVLPVTTGIACPVDGIWPMGNRSAIWSLFDVATVEQTIFNHPPGVIAFGIKDRRAFANLDLPTLTIPCERFPTRCWIPGTVQGRAVRVFIAIGSSRVFIGPGLWNITLQADNSFQIKLSDGSVWTVGDLDDVQDDGDELDGSTEGIVSPFLLFSPSWSTMHRSKLQPIIDTGNDTTPFDIQLGVIHMHWSVILDHAKQQLLVGPRYERAAWTAFNTVFFVLLLFAVLQQYFNPLIRFPPFLNHEKRFIKQRLNSRITGSETAREWAVKNADTQATKLQSSNERIAEIFRLDTVIVEYIGLIIAVFTVLFNFLYLDFTSRIKILFINRVERTALFDDIAFWLVFVVCGVILLTTHLFFIFMTPPASPELRMTVLNERPMLILLVRRYVYEAELCLAIWVTLIEGPLFSFYQVLTFINAAFLLFSSTVYVITYHFQLETSPLWSITAAVTTTYLMIVFLVTTFMVYPIFIIIWPEETDTITPILFTVLTYLIVFLVSAIREYMRIHYEILYFRDMMRKRQIDIDRKTFKLV